MIITTTHLQTFDGHTYDGNDEILAKRCAEMLNSHYPNYLWAVNVNSEWNGGVVIIKNYSISYKYGYTLHIAKLDAKLRKVLMAGGEILERARMARSTFKGGMPKFIDGVPDKHQPIPSMGIII